MNFVKHFFDHTRKPRNTVGGKFMLSMMNSMHNKKALWAINQHITLKGCEDILDIGCGGGQNISHLLKRTSGKVFGMDYSSASVSASLRKNEKEANAKRTEVVQANVSSIPFDSETFDVVTAFETIYFWSEIANDFKEVYRIIKPGGRFFVCNEISEFNKQSQRWKNIIDMQVYTVEEIASLMLSAGFNKVTPHKHPDQQAICIVGTKNKVEQPIYKA